MGVPYPCGISWFIGCWIDDIELLILMENRIYQKFLNHEIGISISRILFNLSIIVLKSSVSNAEDKSSIISCWGLLLSSDVYKSSKSKSSVIWVVCPCRK